MKKLLLLSLMLMLMTLAFADIYEIGTLGTSSAATYGPVSGLYDFGWTKVIVTAAEITAAGYDGTDDIIGLGYYVGNTPANYVIQDVHGFIRTTTLTTYTTTADETGTAMPDSSLFTQVFSGNLTFNGGGWHYFVFNLANFDWDGVSNIEIFWKNWDGDYVTGYPTYRYASTSPDYKCVYKQQDTTWPTTVGTRSTSRSNLALATPQTTPPNPAVLVYPFDAGWAFLDGVLSWSSGGGLPTGFDVYFDTVDGTTLVSPNQPGTSYTPALAAGTTYYWRVDPINGIGTTTGTVWSFSTPTATQIAESFEPTTFPPVGWTNPGAFTRSTTTPYHLTAGAYKSTAAAAMLYTPMLEIGAASELNFMARAGATTGIGRIQIKYSDDAVNWTAIGAEIAMPANSTWNNYIVDLSSIAGANYYIAFENYSSTTTAAAIYIDHVFGPELAPLAPDPAVLVYPADGGWAFTDATLRWTAGTGGIPTGYDVYLDTVNPPLALVSDDQVENTFVPTLAAGTTYYWQVIPSNASGEASGCPVWSFNTPSATQLAESFEPTTFPPLGWANASTGNWTRSTTAPVYHGAGQANKGTSTSVVYVLSTPKVDIVAGSTLNFWTKAAATTQILQVVRSADRVTWTQVGADITYAATSTYYNQIIDLTSLAGNSYYLGFQTPVQTAASSIYVDHVFGPDLTQEAPGPVTLVAPADLLIDANPVMTFSWTAPVIGGIPTGYRVYCDTVNPPITEVADVTGLSTTLAIPLAYNTLYYWTVEAYNINGPATTPAPRSFTTWPDPTVTAFPWTESFDGTTFAPLGWTNIKTAGTGTPGIWDRQTAGTSPTCTPHSGAAMARYNSYSLSSGTKGELITPPLDIPDTEDYRVKFWMFRDSGYATYDLEVVNVYLNETPTSVGGTLLGTISRYYGFAPVEAVANAWYQYEFNFIGSANNKYLVFEAVSQYGNNMFIDDILVEEVPTLPVFTVTPASQDFGTVIINSTHSQTFTVSNTGGGTLTISSIALNGNAYYTLTGLPTLPADLTIGQSLSFGVQYAPLAAGTHTTSLEITDNLARTLHEIPITGTCVDPTITVFPHVEYFDSVTAPVLPLGWTGYVNSTVGTAYVRTYNSTTYAQSAPNSAYLTNSTDAAAELRLITPPIGVDLNTLKLKFYARSSSAGYPLEVGTVSALDGTGVFTLIQSIALTATKTEYTVNYNTYAGTDDYICFRHGLGGTSRSLYVDNVQIIQMFDNNLAALTITGPGYGVAGQALNYVVTVSNEGLLEQSSYTVNLRDAANNLLSTVAVTTPLAAGASAPATVSWTPSVAGNYQIHGEVVLAGDANANDNNTADKAVYILEADNAVIAVGDPAATTTANTLPTNVYYKNGVTEMLYYADEMHLVSGSITALVFKNNFVQQLNGLAFKIWIAHTDSTNLSGGWQPAGAYSLVFDGTLDLPIGINEVIIPLQTPFAYTGGNIVVRMNRVMDTVYYLSTNVWYYTDTTASTPNRSRYLQSDTVTYDPLAPSAAGTLLSRVPNTYLVVDNAVLAQEAVMEGYVTIAGTDPPTPIEGATVTLTDERYTTTTNALGYYRFGFWEAHTVTAAVSKSGYYPATTPPIALTMGNTYTQNFSLFALPQVNVSGTVVGNDAPAGLEGAAIALTGADTYNAVTGPGGVFSIPLVYGSTAGTSYTITITKTGYTTHISTITVYDVDLPLAAFVLNEPNYEPYNVAAALAGIDVNLTWVQGPPPGFTFDFEASNGGWVGSGYGDWQWGNNYSLTGYTDLDTYVDTPPSAAHSGTGLWGTVLTGGYSNSASWSYLRKTFDLTGISNPVLNFWHYMNGYNTWDYGVVKVNGTTVWGSSAAAVFMPWQNLNIDLSAYSGMAAVEISFEWYATATVSYAGWYIDDIYIGQPARLGAPQLFAATMADRSLQSYKVYRLLAADEGTPANWTLLATNVTNPTYLDNGFSGVDAGTYKWAIKAVYSGGLESDAAFSNTIEQTAITAPINVVITKVGPDLQLTWDVVPGATHYKVYSDTDPYGSFITNIGWSATNEYWVYPPHDIQKFYKVTAVTGPLPLREEVGK